jgi:AcrR family transcriptional regulator
VSASGGTSREQMLESAIFLMRQAGLSAAGINQIVEHSGSPKGSVYHYFPEGKNQLAAEALTLYGRRVADAFEARLASKKGRAQKVRALFALIAERLRAADFDASCAAGAVALDVGKENETLRTVVANVMTSWQAIVAAHLPMRTRARAASFAGLVISAIEGGYIRGRAERSTQPLSEASEWLAAIASQEGMS